MLGFRSSRWRCEQRGAYKCGEIRVESECTSLASGLRSNRAGSWGCICFRPAATPVRLPGCAAGRSERAQRRQHACRAEGCWGAIHWQLDKPISVARPNLPRSCKSGQWFETSRRERQEARIAIKQQRAQARRCETPVTSRWDHAGRQTRPRGSCTRGQGRRRWQTKHHHDEGSGARRLQQKTKAAAAGALSPQDGR